MERIRHTLAALALVALAYGSFQPFYLRMWKQDWRAFGAYLTELPYQKVPGLRRVLVAAEQRTPIGARVFFAAPFPSWENGYDYAFRRAQYVLAGRELIPRFGGSTDDADYVLCFGTCAAPRGFTTVWTSEKGSLAKRK